MSTQTLPSGADAAPDVDPPETAASSPPSEQPEMSLRRRFVGWLIRSIPTAIVLTVLAGLGWWGHHSGWALPKFSEVAGEAKALPDDWCEEHGVPETMCVECNPDEYPERELHGWCKVHGVHECPLHHPLGVNFLHDMRKMKGESTHSELTGHGDPSLLGDET